MIGVSGLIDDDSGKKTGLKVLRRMKKIFEIGKKNILFFSSFLNPLYDPILNFPKFDPLTAPGMALCVDLGPKCQILFT